MEEAGGRLVVGPGEDGGTVLRADLRPAVEESVRRCPKQAISIED